MIKLTQRHRGTETESLTFLTGLTGLTRLGNESLLYDKRILTQRGKGAEGQRSRGAEAASVQFTIEPSVKGKQLF